MASVDERRAGFKRYKEDVAGRGKPFFPYAMFHDTVMSLVVVCVIVGLAVIWKYTHLIGPCTPPRPTRGRSSFIPRPDWYFYFLFYLLRIFKWPATVILGTIGIPTIASSCCSRCRSSTSGSSGACSAVPSRSSPPSSSSCRWAC